MAQGSTPEEQRLAALRKTHALDTPPEALFDDLTRVAALLFDTPISLLTLVDEDRQWFKSRHGLDVAETERRIAFCDHTIREDRVFVVEDALADPRFAENPLVVGEPGIRFYAGAPITLGTDERVGTICAIDRRPRTATPEQTEALRALARHAAALLRLHPAERSEGSLVGRSWRELRELRHSRRVLRSILDGTPTMLFVKDLEGRYAMANERTLQAFGLTLDEVVGRTDAELVDPVTATAFREADVRALVEGAHSARVTARDGSEHLTVKFPLLDDDGRPFGTAGIAADLSDQVREEAEARVLQGLYEQQQRLEGLGHLAGGVAHDFNNLLSVILTAAAFAEEAVASVEAGDGAPSTTGLAQVHDDLAAIRTAAERAARLTRQLLVFARRQPGAPQRVDLDELVRETGDLLRRTLGGSIEVALDLDDRPCAVTADRAQLEQVLLNLALNARDAMPDGGTITVRTRHETGETGERIVLEVADVGVGMTPEVLARAFEPFYTTKRAGEGTGLGLATVYGAVAKARGTVSIDSAPGRGTTVRAAFPAATVVAGAPQGRGTTVSEDGDVTVLLVEDQDDVRRIVERILARHGYLVRAVADVAGALSAWREDPGATDVLLSDVVLGSGSGVDLARRLREDRPDLPVLLVSGYPSLEDDDETLPLLEKPFTEAELVARLHGVRERRAT